eukprot:777213-Rhodomonas_salina.5
MRPPVRPPPLPRRHCKTRRHCTHPAIVDVRRNDVEEEGVAPARAKQEGGHCIRIRHQRIYKWGGRKDRRGARIEREGVAPARGGIRRSSSPPTPRATRCTW